MYEFSAWATAVTSIDKYKPNKEYEPIKIPLHSNSNSMGRLYRISIYF
jgi:hypothetical protein